MSHSGLFLAREPQEPGEAALPVARVPGLAGIVLDAIRRPLDTGAGGRRRWVEVAAGVLVAVALIDSLVVGRRSLRDSFPLAPPPIPERQPAIVTIPGQWLHTTEAMLANYSVLKAIEVIPFPIRVAARDEPGYRGEIDFVPDGPEHAATTDRVVLEAWSPNSARVRAVAAAPGFVVLNRSWGEAFRLSTATPRRKKHNMASP